jgi:hypothetical protein
MLNMIRFGLCVVLVSAAAARGPAFAAQTSFYVGTCKPGKADFTAIQTAVNEVPPGSTIHVCPGTYPEQITITKPLTLQGVASGNNDAVIIAAPPGGQLTATIPLADSSTAQILVSNPGGPVDLSGFVVDGTGITEAYGLIESIAYNSASGVINHIAIKNIPPSENYSLGVSIQDDVGVSPSVTIESTSIDGSNSSSEFIVGIGANSTNATNSPGIITLSALNNVITSSGEGIQVYAGVAATLSGNVITGPGDGIDVFNNNQPLKITNNVVTGLRGLTLGNSTAGTVTLSGNTLVASLSGIALGDVTAATVSGNQLIGTYGSGVSVTGIDFGCSAITLTASGNTFISLSAALGNVLQDASFANAPGSYTNVQNIETLCN